LLTIIESCIKVLTMKRLLAMVFPVFTCMFLHAQTVKTNKAGTQKSGSTTSATQSQNQQNKSKKTSTSQTAAQNTKNPGQRSPVAQHHGPKDVTPGSPVGTGGAGGGDMSGSPAGSAIETRDQTDKAVIPTGDQKKSAVRRASGKSKATTNKKKSGQ
jgi:hypothetical protein